jgi:hypothetical protein
MRTIEKQIEISNCCNQDIVYEKGSYMGESFPACWACKRRCKVIKKTINVIDKTPNRFTLFNPNEQ